MRVIDGKHNEHVTPRKVLFGGFEGPDWTKICDAATGPDWLGRGFEDFDRQARGSLEIFEAEQQHKFFQSYEHDQVFRAWRDVSVTSNALHERLAGLIRLISNRKNSRESYSAASPDLQRVRHSLRLFTDTLFARLSAAELPLRRLDQAAEAMMRGEAVSGPLCSVLAVQRPALTGEKP